MSLIDKNIVKIPNAIPPAPTIIASNKKFFFTTINFYIFFFIISVLSAKNIEC